MNASTLDVVAQARAHLASPHVTREELAQDVAGLIEAVENARRCPLTGLWTRSQWQWQAVKMVETGRQLAVVFVDLDGFKGINDTLGHKAGDALLQAVGARLDSWCQHVSGLAARLGGDEFVALVPDTGWLDMERSVLRDELTAPVEYEGCPLKVDASLGVAVVEAAADMTAAERLSAAMDTADQRMYRDKAVRKGGQTTDRRGRLVRVDRVLTAQE